MSLIDQIQQQLDPGTIDNLSRELGETPGTVQNAISAAAPLLANMVGQQRGTAGGGVSSLGGQGGGLLGDLGSAGGLGALGALLGGAGGFGGGGSANAGGLGGLFGQLIGGERHPVHDQVSQASGMSVSKVQRLFTLLAPIVMAALTRRGPGGASEQRPGA